MPRSEEIRHFASLLAGLTIAAVRATSREQLGEIHDALEEALVDAFALLSHDALSARERVDDVLRALGGSRDAVRL